MQRASEAGLSVAASLVVTRDNWNSIAETLDLALSLGVQYLVCNRLIGTQPIAISPSATQLRSAMGMVEDDVMGASYPIWELHPPML